jgi:hypothetical protein
MAENWYAHTRHTTNAYDKFAQACMEPLPDPPPQRRYVARTRPPAIIYPLSRLMLSKLALLCIYWM